MRVILFGLIYFLSACSQPATDQSKNQSSSSESDVKKELLTLEQKWLEAEFALDTAAISPMLDPTFVSINDNDTSNKQQELKGIYENMSTMRKDSIFLDSL